MAVRDPALRLKGQETTLIFSQGTDVLPDMIDIEQFEHSLDLEILSNGFLGEKTDRKDEIFNGISGSFQMQIHNASWNDVKNAIKSRAQRLTPDVTFSITEIYAFPNGQTPTVTFSDIKWGKITETTGSRKDFVTIKAEFACEDYVIQQAV